MHEPTPSIPITIDQIAAEPARALGLSVTLIAALITKCSAEQAKLSAAQNALAAALLDPRPAGHQPTIADRMLTTAEAAEMLRRSPRWIYRNADRLPFVKRISQKSLLCSEAGIKRWLERQRA
jgi:Helix-turn-helix domain